MTLKTLHVTALSALIACVTASCITDSDDPVFRNPLDPMLGGGIPVPVSVQAAVGDNVVELSWGLPEGATADEYAVFRRRVDAGSEMEALVDRTAVTAYTDAGVQNGQTYEYRVAAGLDGQFGSRSEPIRATPGLFAIVIANDADVTRQRSVSVSVNATGAASIQLTEDPDEFVAPWRPVAGTLSWTLSAGDGIKTVYAQLRMQSGFLSLPVSDTIRLDTHAVIEAVDFEGSEIRIPGETVHFRIVAGEANGSARVTVTGVFESVAVLDDGSLGDAVAGDGIYERDLVIPAGASAIREEARGSFTDEAGNQADPSTAPRLLTVQAPLEPVELIDLSLSHPPDDESVTLRWSRYVESDFSRYRVVRSESSPVDEADEEVGSISSAATIQFEDREVIEGVTYYYRIFIQDREGRQEGSNELSALVPNERPPAAVSIHSSLAVSVDRIALGWSQSTAQDFATYRIHRNETGAVTDQDPLVADITDVARTFWDDTGLRENTTYYYRVYTVDQGGLTSRSEEASATTNNEAPPPVVLNAAGDIDSTAVTLSWAESEVHDFARYELYRDEIPTVTRGSTLVVELDDRTFTSFRDSRLEPGTTYYYRVFTIDDCDEPMFAGSNTISVTTTAQRVSP